MRIEKKIKDYFIFSGDTVLDALKRINDNQSRIVFVVQENGVLIGSVSDGDIRRWVTKTSALDLNHSVDRVMNSNFIAHSVSEKHNTISQSFNHKLDIIPLLDEQGRFVSLARKSTKGIQIGDFLITDESSTFIIAEIGNNHNGDVALAKKLVDLAVEAEADCVKFQMRDLTSLYTNKGKKAEADYDLGSQYTLDLLNKFQLSNDDLCHMFDYCSKRGILPLCTPWDLASLKVLDDYGLVGFKVASADFTNFEMLEALGEIGKPIICSTGMSSEAEIKSSVELLRRRSISFSLLHCNSTYPTPYKDVNLSYFSRLKQLAGTIVGYSGHERGFHVPIAAVALGASIIEKHITLDRGMEGNDHKVSLLSDELTEMVKQIRNIEDAMGKSTEREVTQGELINRENLAKSLVINCNLSKGDTIQKDMILVKSPGQGLQPNRIDDLVGKTAMHDFKKGDFFFELDISPSSNKKNNYSFTRPYGIPARYHDYKELIDGISIDFIEFHLSYHDLDLKLSDYFPKSLPIEYAVHCPELFANDHILDLAADDVKYRSKSITELERTIETSIKLNQFFPKTLKPVIVLNAGGWTRESFLPKDSHPNMYERVKNSLNQIDLSSVRIAIQTMPPFPWHFGGQSHHNLFVDPDEIVTFCEKTGHKICLDISHSMMACNFYKWDFYEFLIKVLPYTIHLHISDAKGVDGEGVNTGGGDIDFVKLRELLNQYAPNVPFIPEVWQGHKNSGEGFWTGLEFLEKAGY